MSIHKLSVIFLLLAESLLSFAIAQTSGGLPPIRRLAPEAISPKEAEALINQGWREFVGTQGLVNESRAFNLTLRGVNAVNEEAVKGLSTSIASDARRTRSVGLNNLLVFARCAVNRRIRISSENETSQKAQEYHDDFSVNNAVWDVYLRRTKIKASEDDFINFMRERVGSHPINRYLFKLGNRLPDSVDQAYQVLEDFAKDGDADAALRIAFRHECREDSPQLQQAIIWYEVAISNSEKAADSPWLIYGAKERLQRLRLIQSGRYHRD